jgi:23S rRNA (guanosine2251-2'-O)-methyltransferase
MKKPKWVVEKEQGKKVERDATVWLFGLHAVRDALMNSSRIKLRLIITLNAQIKLTEAIDYAGIIPDVVDARRFTAPIDPGSVHQGVVLLDRVTDPHNVGAILRSAEVLGASAVIGMRHHAAPETGALAKAASGALERQPYVRVRNLADAIIELQGMGYLVLGLDGEADQTIEDVLQNRKDRAVALVLGAEGPGLRQKTKETCDTLVKIDAVGKFGSLNVSNASALALYASRARA